MIHTKHGLKPIEQIKQGDQVLSYNEQTKRNEYKAVIETYVRQTESIVKLRVQGERKAIETTPEHPFYLRIHKARSQLVNGDDVEGEWRVAGRLVAGDKILSAKGIWTKIVGVEIQARNETVYNFQAADNHNYFVGKQGALVHNINCEQWFNMEHAERIAHVVDKYGINLRGRSVVYNPTLTGAPNQWGMTSGANPWVINVSHSALNNMEELAVTIAHELRHSRAFLGSGSNSETAAIASEDALRLYIWLQGH